MTYKYIQNSEQEEELVINSDFANLPIVEKFVANMCKRAHLDTDQTDNMAIAITELVNNAITHGNKQDPQKMVRILAFYHADRIVVAIEDEGEGFDPEEIDNPTDPQNLWKQNGRGVFLVKNLIDEVEIISSPRGTRVVLTEFLSKE